jgi:hypothetical protein
MCRISSVISSAHAVEKEGLDAKQIDQRSPQPAQGLPLARQRA